MLSKLVPLVKVSVVAAAVIAPLSVVDAPDLTPSIVTLLLVVYIWWSLCLTLTVVLPSVNNIEFCCKVLTGRASFCNVTVPVAPAINLAVLRLNFKSSKYDGAHAVLLLDLKRTPTWGCPDIVLVPPTSVSPILEIQTLYSWEWDKRVIQYSKPLFTNIGESNVTVVAVAAVEDVFIWDGVKTFLPKGKILGPGYPLIVFLTSTTIGIVSSFAEKNKSTEVINLPSSTPVSPCTVNDCDSGS